MTLDLPKPDYARNMRLPNSTDDAQARPFHHQTGSRLWRCAGLRLIGGLAGQQLRPTHGSSAMARCGCVFRTAAAATTLTAMMANAMIEIAMTFMAVSSRTGSRL
jgi:hypothetical protein